MKKLHILSFRVAPKPWGISKNLFILLSFLSLLGCSNDDDSGCVGIDCLPPATTTGEGTFGCLVNGKPYVDNSGNFNCYYQFVDGEYYFNISPKKDIASISQIRIATNMKSVESGEIIQLNSNTPGQIYAEVGFIDISGDYVTTNEIDGSIIFTKFNTNSNVASATFEFVIQIPTSQQTYEFTDGRFDSFFTQ